MMSRRCAGMIAVLLVLTQVAMAADENVLLTNNGVNNEEFSQYETAVKADIGGFYVANPALNGGDQGAQVSFAEGYLTNGDASFNFRRKPLPYVYWQGVKQAELMLNLNRQCRIERVRFCLLSPETGPHGTQSVEVFLKGDPLEFPDVLKAGSVDACVDGWNELAVNREADGLRLVFAAAQGKSYITLSEVEVWGTPIGEEEAPLPPSAEHPKRVEDGMTWWAFDFGPANSESFGQFHVSDSKAVYSREKGFGWIPYEGGEPVIESNFGPASTAVPGLGERDRDVSSVDPLYRDLVMTSEYYHTQVRQTFAVDVPDGVYRLMTMHGDVAFGRKGKQNYWIEAEGEIVVSEIELPWSLTTDKVFDVTVADGRLELALDAKHPDPAQRGFAINGLVILPAGTEAEKQFADRKIALIRAAIERYRTDRFEREFSEVPFEETKQMPEPTPEDAARGFVAWTPNWMERIYPNSVPAADDLERKCRAVATPGEYEPATVAIRALGDLKGVRVEIGELTGEDGAIGKDSVEVREVRCWRQRLGSSWSKEYQVMPELLEPLDSVDVPAGTTQQFWLTVHVPDAAAPGTYKAPVRIIADGGRTYSGSLELLVLPFALEPAERPVGMYWRDTQWEPGRIEQQITDMLAHGITAVTLSRRPDISLVGGKLVVDCSELLAFLQHLKKRGITGPIPYYPGLESIVKRMVPPEDFDAMYVETVRQIQAISAREDTPQLLFYPVDEIGNDDERGEKAAKLCSLIGKVPGATSYITVNNYAAGEKWGDSFDIWCGNIEYTAEQEDKLLGRGKRYMRYGPAYLNSSRTARNSSGFGFYRRPAEAQYYWHYQCFNGDPFNDLDGNARDWCAAYPGPDGPIPTLDWEAIREGIDDMRYIATLKKLIGKAQAGNDQQKQLAQDATQALTGMLEAEDGVNQYDFGKDLSDDEFCDLRWMLVDKIIKLSEAL